MSLTVERDVLRDAMGVMASAAARRDAIPILDCVHLEADGATLRVRATDLATSAACEVPCAGALAPHAVSAQLLADVAAAMPDGPVALDAWPEQPCGLRVRAARSEFLLRGMAAEDFPAAPDGEVDVSAIPVGALAAAARLVAIPNPRAAHAFETGVWVASGPDGAYSVVAVCISHFVVLRRGDVAASPICLPARAVRLAAEHASGRITARPIAAALPDLASWTPARADASGAVTCDRLALIAALGIVGAGAADVSTVELTAEDRALRIAARAQGRREDEDVEAETAFDAAGALARTGLSRRRLCDILAVLSSEAVAITAAARPGAGADERPVVRIDGAEGEVAVIAPTQL